MRVLALFAIGMIVHLHVAGTRVVPTMERIMLNDRTFEEVLADVERRAEQNLADRVVAVADIQMAPDGTLTAESTPLTYALNSHGTRQLATLLGVRWSAWFNPSISGPERADEVNRRLSRTPGKLKLRATRDPDGGPRAILRALLSASFTPLDDVRVFRAMATLIGPFLSDFRFVRVDITETTSHYSAVHIDPRGDARDGLHPGWHLRNSEVGASALSLDDFWWRLVCANGLTLELDKRLLYRTHRPADDGLLSAMLVVAMSKLRDRWDQGAKLFLRAREDRVPHPDAAVESVLDSPEVPRRLVEEAQRAALASGDPTRFGVVQAITLVAHTTNTDPDVRFAMERRAGQYLAAA